MGLGPIELNVSVSRVQDYAQIRQNEETKGFVDQTNYGNVVKKETDDKAYTVTHQDDLNNNLKKFDAKEKGSNEYAGDGGRNKNKEEKKEGHVVKKGPTSLSTFDIRI